MQEHFSAHGRSRPYEIPSVRLATSPAPQSEDYGVNRRNVPPAPPYVVNVPSFCKHEAAGPLIL